jgi:hypothetical protein
MALDTFGKFSDNRRKMIRRYAPDGKTDSKASRKL